MWTSIDIETKQTKLGELPRNGSVREFLISEELVPAGAKEILVYATVLMGNQLYPQSDWHYKIYVEIDADKHEAAFYLYVHTDPNRDPKWNALNSDNVWLPIPHDRKLRVKRLFLKPAVTPPADIDGPYFYSDVRVVAYR